MKNYVLTVIVGLLTLAGCKGRGAEQSADDGASRTRFEFRHSDIIKINRHTDGWMEAMIKNPWDTTVLLQTVAIVPDSLPYIPASVPAKATVVRTPLKKSLLGSTVHVGLLEELGALSSIAGVTDPEYIKSSVARQKIASGKITDCGHWMAPNVESIIMLSPDAIFLSPYQNGGTYGQITPLGFPILYTADYMESTPLGRAEWIKYYGLLFGHEVVADSIFNHIENKYMEMKEMAARSVSSDGRPSVLLDMPYMGSWYVHGKGSSNDIFINDAGAVNPFAAAITGTGIPIPPEKVLYEAADADYWLIRENSTVPLSLDMIRSNNNLFTNFKAFKEKNVWGCNTKDKLFYEETPFHPEYLLEELVKIFHPDALSDTTLRYFNRLD